MRARGGRAAVASRASSGCAGLRRLRRPGRHSLPVGWDEGGAPARKRAACRGQNAVKPTRHTAPRRAEIWDALRAATGLDPATALVVLDAAEVKVMRPDMSICYDSRGFRYELPQYVLSDPGNLVTAAG